MSRWIFPLLLATIAVANDEVTSAVSTLTSPGAALPRRLEAVDQLAGLQATAELLDAWAKGGEAVRLAVPVGFHAVGVRGLAPALTAMGSEDEKVRAAGSVMLGSIGRGARLGVRKLTAALTDESPLVRRHAVEALGNIGAAAEESLSGLIALAMEEPALATVAMQAVTRITLDVQLHLHRGKLPDPIQRTVSRAESWLVLQQQEDGSWGDVEQTALVVLALSEGGLRDEWRVPVRKAMRRLTVSLGERPRAEPLVLLATHAVLRETRDPLMRILAARNGARVVATEEETSEREGWRLLALRGAQWSGDGVDPRVFAVKTAPQPDLLRVVFAPAFDATAAAAAAERMLAEKIVWRRGEQRWDPGQIARGSYAIQLAGGTQAEDYRKLVYPAALQGRLVVNEQQVLWEAPRGVETTPVLMTASVVMALKIVSGLYPPRVLPAPKAAKQKMAVAALKGCLQHPDKELQAYARSMLTLWE